TLTVWLLPAAIRVVNGLTTRRATAPAGRVMVTVNVEVGVSRAVETVDQPPPVSSCSCTFPEALGSTAPDTMSGAGAVTGADAMATTVYAVVTACRVRVGLTAAFVALLA